MKFYFVTVQAEQRFTVTGTLITDAHPAPPITSPVLPVSNGELDGDDDDDVPLISIAAGGGNTTVSTELPQLHVDGRRVSMDTYVAVMYENNWYIGVVEAENVEKEEVFVNFMESKGGNKFAWPKHADKLSVPIVDIIGVLSKPCKYSKYWKMSRKEYLRVVAAFHKRIVVA